MSEPSIWLRPRGAVYRGVSGAGSSEIVNPLVVDTTMSRVESDLFYDPTDSELDDHIAQQIAEGFNIAEVFEALPQAFAGIYDQIKESIEQIPKTDLHKAPGTILEGMLRAGTDMGDLLMRVGSGVSMMGFKALPGDASTQYHQLPESVKSFARGYFRTHRTMEQQRARQMMGEANYNYLPSALVDTKLAEGLSLFADPTMVLGFGATGAAKAAAKAALKGTKPSLVSRGIVNAAVKTGEMQQALFSAVGTVATSPIKGAGYVAREAMSFAGEAADQIKGAMPKRITGDPVDIDLPTEGKIGFIRRKINQAVDLSDDAMELASQVKRQSKRQNIVPILDRIARDPTVRSGARDLANVFSAMGRNPVSKGLLIPGYKATKGIAQGAATGGILGLLSFDEEFAASSIAGGALFGPLGQLSSEIIFSKEKNRTQMNNFIDEFKLKLDPDDLLNYEDWTGGSREDDKFFAGLSYMFKNGHFKNGQGNLDIRFLNEEQYQQYGERMGERFGMSAGVNFVSAGGRNTILINTDRKGTRRDTIAHELGHAVMKMPEVQDGLQVQDNLLFGDRTVKLKNGKEVLEFNYEGLLSEKWVADFYDNYVKSFGDDPIVQKYNNLKEPSVPGEDRKLTPAEFQIARDEIYADSMREFFSKFDPETFIRSGKVNNLKFRIGGSYERGLYNGLGGTLARGLIGNLMMARNSLGLYAVRNMGRAMGLIKEGEALKLKDGRVFSNIAQMLQQRRESINISTEPFQDVMGTRWNMSQLNSKDSREILSHMLPTIPILRGEDGLPLMRGNKVVILNRTQRQKHDREHARILKEAVDSNVQVGEMIAKLSTFQELDNGHYRGDFIPRAIMDALQATSKRIITPHLLDTLFRLNERMKGRPDNSGFMVEFTYNQVKETGKRTPDIITSNRQMIPMVFDMSKTGRNFSVTGIDLNDLMTRIDRFERSEKGTERGNIWDLWREEYRRKGGKDEDIDLVNNPVRELFLQDLYLYLSGLSEGKTGIDALGGKGAKDSDLVSVTKKRDGLMRFLGFEKRDQMMVNANMFQKLIDKNRIIKSFRLDRLQNLRISDADANVTFEAFINAQTNKAPGSLYSFKPGKGKNQGMDQDIPIEVTTIGKSEEAKKIQAAEKRMGRLSLTEGVARGLSNELQGAFEQAGISLRVMNVRTGRGGYEEKGKANVAPNIVISVRGDVAQGKKVMDALSLAWDQDGGNVIRIATPDEIASPTQELNAALAFDSKNLSPEQIKDFYTELATLKDDKGNSFLTGFTETKEGMFIGDQFYKDTGDMRAEIKKNYDKIRTIAQKYGVEKFDVEDVVIETFYRPKTKAARQQLIDSMDDLQRRVYDIGKSKIDTTLEAFEKTGDVPGADEATLPMFYDRDKKGNIKYSKPDKPKILTQNYDFLDSPLVQSIVDQSGTPKQAAKDLKAIITSLNTSKLDARNRLNDRQAELYDTIIDRYSDAFAEDFARWKDDPDILSAIGWYSGVAKNISKLIPNDADRHIFLEFLGGTSPNTSVEQNFLYAIDLFNRWKSGGLKQYVDARDKTIKAYENGSLIEQYISQTETPVWSRKGGKIEKDKQGNKVQKTDTDGNPVFEYKWKSIKARNKFVKMYADAESGNKSKNDYDRSVKKARGIADKITPQDILSVSLYEAGAIPVRKNGGKYGVHTDRVFQIIEGVWEAETDAPKAVNFTGNLKGTRTTATIDVWAARFLRRIGYESGQGPWRIQPSAETGVKNSDFYFGQDAFEAATKKIADRYGEKFRMSADDLQAVMWFAEKRNWAQKGWSRVEDFGDFRDYLYKMQQESDGSLKLKDAVLGSTSEEFYNSLEFPAEGVQLPTASRKRRGELADKILASRRKIERARAKVQRAMAQVRAAQTRVDSAKTTTAKARARTALKEKRKVAKQAESGLEQVNSDLRNMREIRMTMESKPVTYNR